MDKQIWLQTPKAERENHLKLLLARIVSMKKAQKQRIRNNEPVSSNLERYQLEEQVLQIIDWIKSENELE